MKENTKQVATVVLTVIVTLAPVLGFISTVGIVSAGDGAPDQEWNYTSPNEPNGIAYNSANDSLFYVGRDGGGSSTTTSLNVTNTDSVSVRGSDGGGLVSSAYDDGDNTLYTGEPGRVRKYSTTNSSINTEWASGPWPGDGSTGSNVFSVTPHPSTGAVYAISSESSADPGGTTGHLAKLNSTGSTVWDYTGFDQTRGGDTVTFSSTTDFVYGIYKNSGNYNIFKHNSSGNRVENLSIYDSAYAIKAVNGNLFSTGDSSVRKTDLSDGSTKWTASGRADFLEVNTKDNVVYAGRRDGSSSYVKALDSSDGSQLWNYTNLDSNVEDIVYDSNDDRLFVSTENEIQELNLSGVGSTDNVVGKVVNQRGAGVANATVDVIGASTNDADISSPTDALNEIDDIADPIPTDWTDQIDSGFSVKSELQQSTALPLIAPETVNQQAVPTWSLDISEPVWRDVPANRRVTVVAWDPTNRGQIINLQGSFDRQLPGGHVKEKREITFEKLTPSGVTQSFTVETEEIAVGLWGKETTLSTGFWRISLENGGSYVISVGNAKRELINEFEKDVNQTFTNAAKDIRSRLENIGTSNSGWVQQTVTTDSNGSFSASVPSDVKAVQIQAYKAPGVNKDPKNLTEDNLTAAYSNGKTNASLFLPASPRRVSTPATNVTIQLTELSYPPWADPTRLQNLSQWRQQFLQNLSLSDLPQSLQQDLRSISKSRLNDLYRDLSDLRNKNDQLRDRISKIADSKYNISDGNFVVNVNDSSSEQLRKRIKAMQQAISELKNQINVQPQDPNIGQNSISQTFTVDGVSIPKDGVTAFVDYSNGTSELVPDQYIAVDQSLTAGAPGNLGETTIRIENFPLGETDPAAVQFRIQVANDEGVGSGKSKPVQNPQSTVAPPGLEHVELSTTAPGPDETVSVDVVGASDSFGSVSNINVTDPDGNTISTSTDNSKYKFTTNGAGVYQVDVTYTDNSGNSFVVPVRVQALNESQDLPPTVRIRSAPAGGRFAVVGDGFESADITTSNAQSRVNIQASTGDESLGEVKIWARDLSLPANSVLSFQATKSDGQTLNDRIGVTLHGPRVTDSALLWYDDDGNMEPFPDSGSAYGSWESQPDQTVIQTRTLPDGSVTLNQQGQPGLVDQVNYRVQEIANSIPDIPTPTLDLPLLGPTLAGSI